MHEGRTSFLIDLWRKIYDAVEQRGGLCDEDDRRLSFTWQPSHTRAHRGETVSQRYLRRGNDAAGRFANRGRMMHKSVDDEVVILKQAFNVALNWARWRV